MSAALRVQCDFDGEETCKACGGSGQDRASLKPPDIRPPCPVCGGPNGGNGKRRVKCERHTVYAQHDIELWSSGDAMFMLDPDWLSLPNGWVCTAGGMRAHGGPVLFYCADHAGEA